VSDTKVDAEMRQHRSIHRGLCYSSSCMLTNRLQQGMRGAWGKPYGSVARVNMLVISLSFTCPVILFSRIALRFSTPLVKLTNNQWSGHHVHPMPRPAPTRHHGGSSTSSIQVRWKAKDHRFQEVGFHFPRQGRLRGIEEGAQGHARWSLRPGMSTRGR